MTKYGGESLKVQGYIQVKGLNSNSYNPQLERRIFPLDTSWQRQLSADWLVQNKLIHIRDNWFLKPRGLFEWLVPFLLLAVLAVFLQVYGAVGSTLEAQLRFDVQHKINGQPPCEIIPDNSVRNYCQKLGYGGVK